MMWIYLMCFIAGWLIPTFKRKLIRIIYSSVANIEHVIYIHIYIYLFNAQSQPSLYDARLNGPL